MIPVTNVRDFYANVREFYLNILRRWLKLAEWSFSLLRLIVNMLALYIKGIEEVLWYICISETTHNLGKVKQIVFLFFKIIKHTVNGWNIYLYIAVSTDRPLLYT